jgi:polysaccharide chain length determinant protein (PEP-CTERM system associated)
MSGLAFEPDIDQQVRMLARTLISRSNVEQLLRMPGLQFDVSTPARREAVVSRLMEQIRITPTGSGNLYEITYRGASPSAARRLVDATVDMFVHSGVGAKRRDSEDAGRFIDEQIRIYEAKLVESENRLKDFKSRNFSASGVPDHDYFTRISAMTEEVQGLRVELAAAERSRDAYRRALDAEEPRLPVELAAASGGASAPEAELRLAAQRQSLDELLRRYTEAHPDVIAARRMIGRLEAEAREHRQAEDRLLARFGSAGRAVTNPVYQKLRLSLSEAEAEVAALQSKLAAQQARLDQLRALAGRMPQVEAELVQLNRDYDVLRRNYDQMVMRRESASLGMKLDESSHLADFRVIEPARVSSSPVFPGRLHLALIAVLVSIAAGFAAAVVADLLRPTFADAASLQQFSGRPVLGTVSLRMTPHEARARRAGLLRFAAALSALAALQLSWVAWVALTRHAVA